MAGSITVKTGNASIDRKGQTRGNLYGHNNRTQPKGRGKPVDENNGR